MSTCRFSTKGKRVGARRAKHVVPNRKVYPAAKLLRQYRSQYESKYASMFWRLNLQRMAAKRARGRNHEHR